MLKKYNGVVPENVHVVREPVSVYSLIADSCVILSYNSTVLLEALLCNKPILTPYYGDIIDGDASDIFNGFSELVNYVKTYEELDKMVKHPRDFIARNKKRDDYLELKVYKTDGNASKRTEEQIVRTIRNCQNDV